MEVASEQSQSGNSQPEVSMESRIESLLYPEPDKEPEPKAPEQQAEEQPAAEVKDEGSQEEPKADAESEKSEIPQVEDVEYEGKTYKVAPELKEALLRQADYTKKTQETAEQRKAAENLLQQATRMVELQKAMSPKLGALANLDEQIAHYEKIDWNSLFAQNSAEASRLSFAYQQAKDARGKVVQELSQIETEQMTAAQKARQAKLEEGHKALTSHIKGWSPELGQKILQDTHKAYGAPLETLAGVAEPWAVRALHDAMQWRNLQASKSVIEKKAPPVVKTLKPQAGENRTPQQESYDADRRAIKSAKTDHEKAKAVERLMLRKL